MDDDVTANDIAIVGMAVHLPGAQRPAEFWSNLRDGVESVRRLDDESLIAAGVHADELRDPSYVKAAAVLGDVYGFDAEFFGFSPKEAGILDPQHRHFLMAVWEALEDAGHVPERFDGAIGLFAGCGANNYYSHNILTNADLVSDVGLFLLRHTGNDKDFLATRASYLFDLRGPAVNVQTACSTSLVATHLAVQHLLSGEVDLALAGGVTIETPHNVGYHYREGEILSPDGHCRPFDHRAQGTIFGSGVGIVALRRLDDAVRDGDHVYAVIKGSAVNNDGAQKVGYLAPSVDGQAACIAEALAVAGVDADSLQYVECHGTGTPVGDPIEVAALTNAFRASGSSGGGDRCRIGSVKSNIGHLDTAAGVASLVKVALSLTHREMPPSLNFEADNPLLEIESSPFAVNAERRDWVVPRGVVRRAGVNSLGVGGTNAFVVLEEAPPAPVVPAAERWRLVALSARSRTALGDASSRLAEHLRDHPDLDLADVAWTAWHGRRHFTERRVVAARDAGDAAALLEESSPRRVFSDSATEATRRVAFMFPGGGSQHVGMAAGLHRAEPVFAAVIDEGLRRLRETEDLDLRPYLLGDPTDDLERAFELMIHQLPAIFLVEYALSELLRSWDLVPDALVGHSVGENTAACVSGTMSFAECLALVTLRGRLMDRVSGGALLVPLPREELEARLAGTSLDLAVVNAPELCVVSGARDHLEAFEATLRSESLDPQRVRLNVGPHSRQLDPVLDEFRQQLESMTLRPPTIPWVSNRTGTWITESQACDPGYWVEHLRHTVDFAGCLATLADEPGRVLLEVGPGKTLSSLARAHPDVKATQPAIPAMRHADEDVDDEAALVTAVGRLWAAGGELSDGLQQRLFDDPDRTPRRVALPTYPFQTSSYFIRPGRAGAVRARTFLDREADRDAWFWEWAWRSADAEIDESSRAPVRWLVFADEAPPVGAGLADSLAARLRDRGDSVVIVRAGGSYAASDDEYVIVPENGGGDFESMVRDLIRTDRVPDRVAHCSLLALTAAAARDTSFLHRTQELGFQSLVFFAKAWVDSERTDPLHVVTFTTDAQRADPVDRLRWPEQSTVLGPAMVMPRELEGVTASVVDVDLAALRPSAIWRRSAERIAASMQQYAPRPAGPAAGDPVTELVEGMLEELLAAPSNDVVARRGSRRLVRRLRRARLQERQAITLRHGGVVVITGGLGGIGLSIADELFTRHRARLVLVGRHVFPARDQWDEVIARLPATNGTVRRIERIRALESRGAEIVVESADVTNVEEVHGLLDRVRARLGAVHAVVHAAGTVSDALIAQKSLAAMNEVLATKVHGTLNLEVATSGDELDAFVVFSSTSTATAPPGQVDYVAANSFLNAWAESRQAAGKRQCMAIDWGVWSEVGMAAEALRQPIDVSASDVAGAATHPWFDERVVGTDGRVTIHARWPVDDTWFLDDHRTAGGQALLPGSAYLEIARAALAEVGVDRPFVIAGLTFLRPLANVVDGAVSARVVLEPTEAGYDLVVSEFVAGAGMARGEGVADDVVGWRRTAQARLLLHRVDEPERIETEVFDRDGRRLPTTTGQHDQMRFGPRWDVIKEVRTLGHGAIARIELPAEFRSDVESARLHPALVDLATGYAMHLIDGYTGDELWVPVSYRRVTVYGPLPDRVVSIASVRPGASQANGFARFDVRVYDHDGRLLLAADEFTIKRLDQGIATMVGRPPVAGELEPSSPTVAPRHESTAERQLRHNVSMGIRPSEGADVFTAALSDGRPVVYASSIDLAALVELADHDAVEALAGDADAGVTFERPALDAAFVAPRDDVEAALATAWQELLGIDQVGVDDDFFELGGHSLIAVRLFARMKQQFSVDFPISILFQAPTIAECAALIRNAKPQESTAAAGPDESMELETPTSRYVHLVPMHQGEPSARTPFFLVGGVYGNVLNFYHLAELIGDDRPVYGVQARGLFGEAEPHESFEEMARDYLAEIRQVQPHGPYLLGGYSGGGITAYEMAQQLRAVGEEVGALVFLDSPLPVAPITRAQRLRIHAGNAAKSPLAYVRERLAERSDNEQRLGGGAIAATMEAAFNRALYAYQVKPYEGTVTLFRPPLVPRYVVNSEVSLGWGWHLAVHDNGWGRHAREVVVHEVPGNHTSMVLEPNVKVLAARLRSTLDAAEATAGLDSMRRLMT